MGTKADEYFQRAAEAEERARQAEADPALLHQWREIASGWLYLAEQAGRLIPK